MKTLFTLVFAICMSQVLFAQTFNFSTEMHIVDDTYSSTFFDYEIKFDTDPAEDITFMWERIEDTFPEEWSYSLCDYGDCYIGIPVSGHMDHITQSEMTGGTHGFFKLTLGTKDFEGSGIARLYVYDSTDYNRGDTVSFTISFTDTTTSTGGGTGIADLTSAQAAQVFPNPATTNLFITWNSSVLEYQVTNVLGQVVESKATANKGATSLDVSNWDRGIYFLNYRTEEGSLLTQKIILH